MGIEHCLRYCKILPTPSIVRDNNSISQCSICVRANSFVMKYIIIIFIIVSSDLTGYSQVQQVDILSDGIPLAAFFYETEGDELKPTMIWCHGNPGGKEEGTSKFALELNKLGINILRFNYRGLWGTDGVFKLRHSIGDLTQVLDFVHDRENVDQFKIDTSRIITGGYSYGTQVLMTTALKDRRVKNIFCLGLADHNQYFFTPESLNPENERRWRELHPYVNNVLWGPERNFDEISNEFNLDIMRHTYEYDFVSKAERFKDRNVFIVVGLNDLMAPIEHHFLPLHRMFVEMNHEHYAYKIIEADHYFRNLSAQERAQIVAAWIDKL